jgi:hypothetical protein
MIRRAYARSETVEAAVSKLDTRHIMGLCSHLSCSSDWRVVPRLQEATYFIFIIPVLNNIHRFTVAGLQRIAPETE